MRKGLSIPLDHSEGGTFAGLCDIYAYWEGLLQLFYVSYHDYLLKIVLNCVNSLHQPLQTLGVLSAESLVYK